MRRTNSLKVEDPEYRIHIGYHIISDTLMFHGNLMKAFKIKSLKNLRAQISLKVYPQYNNYDRMIIYLFELVFYPSN